MGKIFLYDIFNHWQEKGSIFIYSDPHFSDKGMKEIRTNYIDDKEQIKRINTVLGKHDTIIFLGDIGNVECIKKIRGYKVLIKGNHDLGDTLYKEYFNEVYRGSLTINDKIILSHQPRGTLPYEFNIHGHIHNINWKNDDNHFNCCAECINYTPIRLDEIICKCKVNKIKTIHRYFTDIAKEDKNEIL